MVLRINCLQTGYSKLWKSLVSSKPLSSSEWSCRSGLRVRRYAPVTRLAETVNTLTEALYPLSRFSEAGVDNMTGASLYQPDLI